MKTQIWPDQVRFGKVQQVGKDLVSIEPEDGRKGQTYRLYFSHLRSAEAAHGGVVFVTGQNRTVHRGNKVAFVPQKDRFWLWAMKDEYDLAVMANSKARAPASLGDSQSEMEKVCLDPALFQALGRKQVEDFHRRFAFQLPTTVYPL